MSDVEPIMLLRLPIYTPPDIWNVKARYTYSHGRSRGGTQSLNMGMLKPACHAEVLSLITVSI